MLYGSGATIDLRIATSSAAPTGGSAGFELLVGSFDPASGEYDTGDFVIGLQA